jgi:Uma2 family endonuclease
MDMPVTAPRYTVDDLDRFPDDGNRWELLDGQLLVTPSPSLLHQVVSMRLAMLLADVVQRSGVGHVLGPGVVTTPPLTQLQPDILVCRERGTGIVATGEFLWLVPGLGVSVLIDVRAPFAGSE